MKILASVIFGNLLLAAVMCSGPCAAAAEVADGHVVAGFWALDEGRGERAVDQSANRNHGIIRGATWVTSEAGPALRFSPRERSHVEVSNAPSLDLAEVVCIELDVKTYGATGRWQGVLAKRDDGNQRQKVQYQLALRPDLELSYCVNVGGGDNWWYPSTGLRLTPNQWHHVVARYDALLGRVTLQLDEEPPKILEGVPVVHPSANPVHLGWTGWSDEFLDGELRRVRIVNGLEEKIDALTRQGVKQPLVLRTDYLPHRYESESNGLRGILEAALLNPGQSTRRVTMRVRAGEESGEASTELPARGWRRISCEVPESATNRLARVEFVEAGQAFTNQTLTVPGAQAIRGYRGLVVSHTHSDLAWADSIPRCLDANVAAIAKSVELAEAHPEYRFAMEHTLFLREYLRRFPERLATVRRLLRAGNLEVGAFFTGPWELTCGAEGLARELYLGKLWVKRELGFDTATVWNVDVAGHTAQLPQLLAKAGVRGLVISAGSDANRGPALFRWQSRDGSEVLTWTTPWGYGASGALGLRQETLEAAARAMPRFLETVQQNHEAHHLPRIAFIADGSDLESPTARMALNLRQWNRERRFPRMIQASSAELFEAVAGAPLPAFSGEMPSPWDSVQAQGNDCFLTDRRLEGRVLAAEKFAAIASVVMPDFTYPGGEFDQIWQNRLFTMDHNWGGRDGANTARIKAGKVKDAARMTDAVLERTLGSLTGAISAKPSGAARIVVFNPLSWERADEVTCAVPVAPDGLRQLGLTDGDGRAVPFQAVSRGTGEGPPASTEIVFIARAPSLGYATYYLDTNQAPGPASSPFQTDTARQTFENAFFRLQFDPASGGLKSIYDRGAARELVRQGSRYVGNELVAWEDDDVDIGVHLTGRRWSMREHPSTIGVVENGPVRLVVEVTGRLMGDSTRRQQVVLYRDLPRLDFITRLDWAGTKNVQLYQVFPLATPEATARYAVPYGWEQYGEEMKYAAPWFSHDTGPVAKHRWRGVRGWIELANPGSAVVLSTDCNYAAFRDLAPQAEPGFMPQPLLLRTVRSCGDDKLFYQQPGEHVFRFALQTQADPARCGAELDSPLLSRVVSRAPAAEATLPDRFSFAQVTPANVHLAVLKGAEDGRGLIARLVETRERSAATRAEIQFNQPLREARRTSLIEEDGLSLTAEAGKVELPMKASAIETLRLGFSRR